MSISRKRIWVVFTIVILLIAVYCVYVMLFVTPSRDAVKLAKYVDKHESELIDLAGKYPNQYEKLNNYLGVIAIDTREDDICFAFSWSFDIPEGGSFLYFSDDGILDTLGYSFIEDTYIDGLGITGQGYIRCFRLDQNWFFVEHNIPT